MPSVETAWVFLGLSILFGTLAARDYMRNDRQLSPAARTWRNLSVIFLVMSLVLVTTGA